MKKNRKILLGVLVLLIILVGCGKKMDTEKEKLYSKKADETIQLLNSNKTEEFQAQLDDSMKETMTKEVIDSMEDYIKSAGSFEKIEKASVEEKEGNFVTVSIAKYADKKIIYTISFDDSGKIIGLYYK